MTEAEWLACTNPRPMLEFLRGKASDRKLRLFGCACCRRVWQLLSYESSRMKVELAEGYADGVATADELHAAYANYGDPGRFGTDPSAQTVVAPSAFDAARAAFCHAANGALSRAGTIAADAAARGCGYASYAAARGVRAVQKAGGVGARAGWEAELHAQADLLRDIFGNHFRPVALDPSWRTPTVAALATAAYEERILPSGNLDTQRLVIREDDLEDAGCGNAELLDHLRGPGPHVRGCWAVDLLLGKE